MSDTKIFMIVSSIFIVIATGLAIAALAVGGGAGMRGEKGNDGVKGDACGAGTTCVGTPGNDGLNGNKGDSAFQVWKDLKPENKDKSEDEFFASLGGGAGDAAGGGASGDFATKEQHDALVASLTNGSLDVKFKTMEAGDTYAWRTFFGKKGRPMTAYIEASSGANQMYPTRTGGSGPDNWTRPRLWTT